jgi:hypothetical protein
VWVCAAVQAVLDARGSVFYFVTVLAGCANHLEGSPNYANDLYLKVSTAGMCLSMQRINTVKG